MSISRIKPYLSLMRLDKPVGTLLLLWPTLWALIVASQDSVSIKYIIVFSLGVFLTRSSGCVINDIMDADFDIKVKRTQNRPLAQKLISKSSAYVLFIILNLLALTLAICFLKLKTVLLAIPACLILTSYPYMKRIFAIPQLYLGLAFSFGILMAFMELQDTINLQALILFLANVCWVVGYDTFYALADIADDRKIGIKTSALTMEKHVIKFISICYFFFISLLILMGWRSQFNLTYLVFVFIAATFLIYQVIKAKDRDPQVCFKMFLLNNWVGVIITLGILFK